jgi:hypothetical protein
MMHFVPFQDAGLCLTSVEEKVSGKAVKDGARVLRSLASTRAPRRTTQLPGKLPRRVLVTSDLCLTYGPHHFRY